MAHSNCMHCARCQRDVAVAYQYSAAMRRWWKAYFYVPPLLLVPLAPFLAGDYVVTLPLMMVYMLGFGPVLAIVRDPPTCGECGALIPRPVRTAAPPTNGARRRTDPRIRQAPVTEPGTARDALFAAV